MKRSQSRSPRVPSRALPRVAKDLAAAAPPVDFLNPLLLVAGAIAVTGLAGYATVAPSAQLFGPVLLAPPRPNELALTFDDGPNPAATPQLLDLLAAHNIRATFFLIGRHALAQPALVRRIAAAGHALGNHTMSHPRLPLCAHARIVAELRDASRAIEDLSGTPLRLFRPPHGFRTPYVLGTARDLGLTTTTWTTIANDWSLTDPEVIAARVQAGIARSTRRGLAANIALHDGSQQTPTPSRQPTLAATALLLARLPQAHYVPLTHWLS